MTTMYWVNNKQTRKPELILISILLRNSILLGLGSDCGEAQC